MIVQIRHKIVDKIKVGQEFRVSKAVTIKVIGISCSYKDIDPHVMITIYQCYIRMDILDLPVDL